MRENKFRIWNITLQRMSKSKTMQELIETAIYEEARRLKVSENYDNLIFMQYTGLKDKNGKEIFESDIIKGSGVRFSFSTTSSEVYFGCDGAQVQIGDYWIQLSNFKEREIIGNKYENNSKKVITRVIE